MAEVIRGIKVEPVKGEELRIGGQFLPIAKALIDLFAKVVYPDVEKVEEPQNTTIRTGRGVLNVAPSEDVAIITYSRFNGDKESPVFHRGRWIVNAVRALALARELLEQVKKGNFTYKLSDSVLLMKDGSSYKLIDVNRGVPVELPERERELLEAALDAYLLSGGAANFGGENLGRIRAVNGETYRIGGITLKIDRVNRALLLKELL